MAFQDMVDFLDSTWHCKHTIVPCLLGPVGIGKTAAVQQHAKNVGAGKIVTIIASQILPNEVSGITMPEADTKSMQIYDHYRLSSLEDGDILFFDELLEADQYVLSACLTLIESRMMMSGKLLPDIQIIAAANPTVSPQAIRVNIRQRFMFRKFGIDDRDTRDYIKNRFGIDLPMSLLKKMQEDGDDYNVLSPRSLTKICEWLTGAEDLNAATEQVNKCWHSTIGTEIGEIIVSGNNKLKEEAAAHLAIQNVLTNLDIEFDFEEDIEQLISRLRKSERWNEVADELSKINFDELMREENNAGAIEDQWSKSTKTLHC